MKNYRSLAPILLIILFALGWYYVIDGNERANTQYNALAGQFDQALAAKNTYVVHQTYDELNKMRPMLDQTLKLGAYVKSNEPEPVYSRWLSTFLATNPSQVQPYELAVEHAIEQKQFKKVYEFIAEADRNAVDATALRLLSESVKYQFQKTTVMATEAGEFSPDGVAVIMDTIDQFRYMSAGGTNFSLSYQAAGPFINGAGPIIDKDGQPEFLDRQGKVLYEIADLYSEFSAMGSNQSFAAESSENGRWRYVNTDFSDFFQGNHNGEFEEATPFAPTKSGSRAAVKLDGRWTLINLKGEATLPNTSAYSAIALDPFQRVFVHDRFFAVPVGSADESFKMYDVEGNDVCAAHPDFEFTNVKHFSENSNVTAVEMNRTYRFIDTDCNLVLPDLSFSDAKPFSDGLAAVKQGAFWGYIDTNGAQAIDAVYEEANSFTPGGVAFVKIPSEFSNSSLSMISLYSQQVDQGVL